MFAFGFEEEGVFSPDIDAAFGTERLIDFGDFGGRSNWITNNAATNLAHDVGDRAVAVDNVWYTRVFRFLSFHDDVSDGKKRKINRTTAQTTVCFALNSGKTCR